MDDLKTVINKYLTRGFGSMNKNEFEVWIFHYLLSNRFINENNYDISIQLRIPETKVKRLRYEAELKYGDPKDEESYRIALEKLLEKSIIKKDGNSVQFSIENIQLRKFLDSKLKKAGRFSDSSFNSEIVVIDVDDLEYLLKVLWPEKYWNEIENRAKKKIQSNKITFKEILKNFVKGFATNASKISVDLTYTGILKLIDLIS